MKIFNSAGVMIVPIEDTHLFKNAKKTVVVKEVYCQNGHSLVSSRAQFSGHDGIMVKVIKEDGAEGTVALSPIYGDKSRMSLDIDLNDGEFLTLKCPECDVELPIYSDCKRCEGGKFIAMYHTKEANIQDSIVVCNKVGCPTSEIISGEEILTEQMLEAL